MTDPRTLADDAVQYLDRLGAVILDDVGDGPPISSLASAAAGARDAVARLAVPALTQLTGLVAGVADSIAAGSTEWNPSLGGTLMAAVDDLRHLVSRASEFSDEDSEHLHHRASELSVYVRTSMSAVHAPPVEASGEPPTSITPEPEVAAAPVATNDVAPPVLKPDAVSSEPRTTAAPIIPISQLFYAEGPHIVSGGVPPAAAGTSELLGKGIDALDNLMARPLAPPATSGAIVIVPVESLLYRGRAALERASAIRAQIRSSGSAAPTAALDEMYDLIDLALKD